MINHPSPKDRRSLPSNFGVDEGARVAVAPDALKIEDQFGNVEVVVGVVAAAGLSITNGPGEVAAPLKFEASQYADKSGENGSRPAGKGSTQVGIPDCCVVNPGRGNELPAGGNTDAADCLQHELPISRDQR
jgi:hypothetical protein